MVQPLDGNTGETTGLPFSQGLHFETLDAYLAHLERRGAMDVPWYKEVAPGLYELMSGRGRRPTIRYTRAELMQRFGFAGEATA